MPQILEEIDAKYRNPIFCILSTRFFYSIYWMKNSLFDQNKHKIIQEIYNWKSFLYYNVKCICKLLYIATTFLLEFINIQYEKVCGSHKSGFN